jgi:hypothetical protein
MAKITLTSNSSNGSKRVTIGNGLEISRKQHDDLVHYIKTRLLFAKELHDPLVDRFEIIDRELYGYLILDEEDSRREKDNRLGKGPKVTDTIIPLVLSQCDEALTFFMSVLAPDDGIYTAMAPKDKQKIAAGFASLMNKHATKFKHYKHMSRFIFDGMKYNRGGCEVNWSRITGAQVKAGVGGVGVTVERGEVFAGNELTALDMYNTLVDPTIDLTDMALKGEFFAKVAMHTPFRVKKMQADGEIFNIDDIVNKTSFNKQFYRTKPEIRTDGFNESQVTDWTEVLTAGFGASGVGTNIEFVTVNIWLPTNQFGLSQEEEFQIWRVVLAANENNLQVVRAEPLNNAHGMLPIGFVMPWDDGLEVQTKSYAELLIPYQRFASFQMNVHQRAARKALYGVTFYDKQQVPLMESADVLAGKIPVNPTSADRDIRKSVFQFNDAPDTQNTLRDIDAVDALMQKILPTDMLKQVTSLERATQYQAAATVQGANRRNLKIAKIMDAQAFDDIRQIQMFNIYQFQESTEIIDDAGNLVEVKPADFIEAEIEFAVSDGLKGLDKLAVVTFYKDFLNSALQSQQINEQMDLIALLDYMSSFIGDKTDISQFKFKTQFDALTPEQKDLAFQLLQQAAAAEQQAGGQPAAPAAAG